MPEIKQAPIELVEGVPYIPVGFEVVFTDEHTISDVVRWLIDEGCAEDALYLLKEAANA